MREMLPSEDDMNDRVNFQTQRKLYCLIYFKERNIHCKHIQRTAVNGCQLNVSDQTIGKRQRKINLSARRPTVRLDLIPTHRAVRLVWFRRHQAWLRQQRATVHFADESNFAWFFNLSVETMERMVPKCYWDWRWRIHHGLRLGEDVIQNPILQSAMQPDRRGLPESHCIDYGTACRQPNGMTNITTWSELYRIFMGCLGSPTKS